MDTFDVYFSTIVGWQYHPGNRRDGVYLSIHDCALIALEMIQERAQLEESSLWPQSQQPS